MTQDMAIIVPDTNVLIRYRNVSEKKRKKLVEYLDNAIDAKMLHITEIVNDEFRPNRNDEFLLKLYRYCKLKIKDLNYKQENNRSKKKRAVNDNYQKINDTYREINDDPSESMQKRVNSWAEKKWENRRKKNLSAPKPDLTDPIKNDKNDRKILAEAIFLAEQNSDKTVNLITFDMDFLHFSNEIQNKFPITIEKGYDYIEK